MNFFQQIYFHKLGHALNTANLKGHAAFFTPFFWSQAIFNDVIGPVLRGTIHQLANP